MYVISLWISPGELFHGKVEREWNNDSSVQTYQTTITFLTIRTVQKSTSFFHKMLSSHCHVSQVNYLKYTVQIMHLHMNSSSQQALLYPYPPPRLPPPSHSQLPDLWGVATVSRSPASHQCFEREERRNFPQLYRSEKAGSCSGVINGVLVMLL